MAGGVQTVPTERQVQRAILKMCGVCFPEVFVTHVPNGAHLAGGATARFKQMGALKGDGLKPGFYDLLFLWFGGKGGSMEVKRGKGGVVSESQKAMGELYDRIAWPNAIVTSVDAAYLTLREWGAPWSGIDPRQNPIPDAFHPEKRK